MDGRARFALAQAQKEARKAAISKVGLAEDLYVDLQRNHRKLKRCRIRASEVHVKTSRRVKTDENHDWDPSITGVLRKPGADHAKLARQHGIPGINVLNVDQGGGFTLPNYILDMNKELLEDDFELPDADRGITPGPQAVALADLGLGLGDAAAAASVSALMGTATAAGGVAAERPSCVASGPLAELSMATTLSAPGTSRATADNGSRAAARNRDRLLPLRPGTVGAVGNRSRVGAAHQDRLLPLRPGTCAADGRAGTMHQDQILPQVPRGGMNSLENIVVPTKPLTETMPQHLASDVYWVRNPVYVSAQQVRWEKRDGAQTLIAMRRELMQKLASDGMPRSLVQPTTLRDQSPCSPKSSRRPMGPAEAKLRASDPMRM